MKKDLKDKTQEAHCEMKEETKHDKQLEFVIINF